MTIDWRKYTTPEERRFLKTYEAAKRQVMAMSSERRRIQMRAIMRAKRKAER